MSATPNQPLVEVVATQSVSLKANWKGMSMDGVVSSSEAAEAGMSHYFTGKPCKHGHIAKREVVSCNCIECYETIHAAARAESKSRYRENNPQHIIELERRGKDRHKYLARIKAQKAVKSGKLCRQPCEVCGQFSPIHAHHEDYSKPMDVVWLCPLHHSERHRAIEAERKGVL